MEDVPAWADRLHSERRRRLWSQREMARRLARAAELDGVRLSATRVSLTRMIGDWEAGRHKPKDPYRVLYARVFDLEEADIFDVPSPSPVDSAVGGDLAGFVEEVEPTKRREALKLGLAAIAPETLRQVLRDAADDAMEFTRLTGVSALGTGTLRHLDAVVTALDGRYSNASPAELFMLAREYRSRVGRMLQKPTTLKQARELYVYAAWLSEMLAWLAHDLGDSLAGEAWAIDSFEHADQAGHDELCAWATDAMASIAIYTNHPGRAIAAARRGIAKAPVRHPLAVRLRAQAARAHARLGDREQCEALLGEAAELYGRLPPRAPMRFGTDTGVLASFAMTSYSASSFVWLGDAERGDFEKARVHAHAAITAQESLPKAVRSPSREAIARIDLGIALAELGAPDQAAALGRQALASRRFVDSVRSRAGDLDRVLTARYPDLGLVREFHDAYVHASHTVGVSLERS